MCLLYSSQLRTVDPVFLFVQEKIINDQFTSEKSNTINFLEKKIQVNLSISYVVPFCLFEKQKKGGNEIRAQMQSLKMTLQS